MARRLGTVSVMNDEQQWRKRTRARATAAQEPRPPGSVITMPNSSASVSKSIHSTTRARLGLCGQSTNLPVTLATSSWCRAGQTCRPHGKPGPRAGVGRQIPSPLKPTGDPGLPPVVSRLHSSQMAPPRPQGLRAPRVRSHTPELHGPGHTRDRDEPFLS